MIFLNKKDYPIAQSDSLRNFKCLRGVRAHLNAFAGIVAQHCG